MAFKSTTAFTTDGIFPPDSNSFPGSTGSFGDGCPIGPEMVAWYQSALFDRIPEVIFATDKFGIISYWNHPAEKLFCRSAWETLGSPAGSIFCDMIAKPVMADIHQALNRNGHYYGEIACTPSQGKTIYLDMHARLIQDKPRHFSAPSQGSWLDWSDQADEIQGAVISVRDVTPYKKDGQALARERLQAEQALAQLRQENARLRTENCRLRQDDARKRHFLNIISHELRNPLAAIQLGQDMLRQCLVGDRSGLNRPVDDESQRELDMIERQTHLLTRLVDDLLDVSRLNAKKLNLKPVSLNLNELVAKIIADHRIRFWEKGIALHARLSATPIILQADPIRLSQVLDNLLHNALKFTERGGTVRVQVRVSAAPVAASQPNLAASPPNQAASQPNQAASLSGQVHAPGEALIQVSDTGVGIEPDKLDKLFCPFVQIDSPGEHAHGDAAAEHPRLPAEHDGKAEHENGTGHGDDGEHGEMADHEGMIDHGGLGLGLSIAKGLIALHGGYIVAESGGSGCGTQFTVHLPMPIHPATD